MDTLSAALQQHFNGTLSDLTVPGPDQGPAAPTADLHEMAHLAMNYALRTPNPALDYACYFSVEVGACPPQLPGLDLVAVGDTDIRLETALAELRAISGRTDGLEVDAGLFRRVSSYCRDDNFCYIPYASACSPDLPPDTIVVSPWTTGFLLRSLTDKWALSRDPALVDQARALFNALRGLAHWRGDLAWYPGGSSGLLGGQWLQGNWGSVAYPTITHDVAHYAELIGDEEALHFAHAFARGQMAGLQENLGVCKFREDGSFTGHTHMHTRTLWGMAQTARLTEDRELQEWARRGYEFVRVCGTDYGSFPERTILPGEHPHDGYEERVDWFETCCTGDMVHVATELALGGRPEYWDHVERYVANHVRLMQFHLTPEWEAWFRREHASLPAAELEAHLARTRDYEGGFVGMADVGAGREATAASFNMCGCCVPEGMRAINTAWREAVVTGADGVTHVRMAFARRTEAAAVEPIRGGVRVQMRRDGDLAVRPPAWAPREEVRVALSAGAALSPTGEQWQGAEVLLRGLRRGQEVAVTWPEPVFTQRQEVGGKIGARKPLTMTWRGNRLLSVGRPGG